MAGIKHSPPRPVSSGDFEIAVICALTLEADAVLALFDHHWDDDGPHYDKASADPNAYSAGAIGRHNVILVHMPGMGKANGAAVAANCRSSFPNIKLAIIVGVCGVVPFGHDGVEITLGDVVVSDGVVQYDLGRLVPERFVQKDTLLDLLGRPNVEIRSLLTKLRGIRGQKTLREKMVGYLNTLQTEPELAAVYPGTAHDRLFEAAYRHRRDGMSCDACGCDGPLVPRIRLEQDNQQPAVHFGLMASGDTVMKSGEDRDRIARQKRIVAFEMEGVGVWDTFPCVVIKGACDYADSHKSQEWQRYAAATAAACMRAFLDQWMPSVSLPLVQPTVLEYFARPWFLVPYPRNETFVGRSAVLEILQQQILKSESQERVSLFGCGGVGKTQIALEYVYWLQTKHKDMSVFWVHASNSQQFRQSYAFIAQACRIPGFDDPQADVLPLVKSWLNRKDRAGWWLMVIDNADDAQLFYPSPKETNDVSGVGRKGGLGRYIPECAHGSILATARTQQAGRRLAKGKGPIFVGTTNDTESEELIRAHLNGTSATRANLLTLSSRLDNLPLALVQAATYIEKASITVQQYLQLLAIEHENMVELLSDQSATVGLDPEAMKAVALTCVIALKQIERRYPLASELLFFMSLLERQGIPLQLLLHYRDRKWERGEQTDMNLGNAIEILKSYSFVEEDNDGNYGLHRLVQLMTLRWLTEKGKIEQFKRDALVTVSYMFPYGRFETRASCAALLSHANAVLGFEGSSPRDEAKARASLLHCMAGYYIFEGNWARAENLSLEAAEIRKRLLGVTHSDTLASMSNLASTYRSQGRWEEAEKLEVQVMETVKTKVGVDHPDTLASMANVASTYRSQGRWEEAERLEVQVMEMVKTKVGVDHSDTLASMANLASTYRSQGRWEEAEKLEVQVMETVKTKVGVDHPDTLASMINLASTYRSQGRWGEAEKLLIQVVEISRSRIGAGHPYTLSGMSNLALIYNDQGRWEEAERLETQVVEAWRMKLGVDHPNTLSSMANLASIYKNLGRWEEAEDLFVQVIETSKKKIGVDHPETLASMAKLASTYRSQSRWEEAEMLLIQVVETNRSRIGADHPNTLSSMSNLALTYNDQGRLKEAEQLETQVVEAWRMKLGVDHPNTLSSMANLALIYKNLGRWEEAEDLFVQVIETSKKKIGVDHPDTLASMDNLVLIYGFQGRLEEARSLQSKITKTQEARGAHHLPDTSESQQTILDQDSGYASVSRLTTLSAHSESAFEVVTKPFATEKHDNAVKLSDELQSLASDDDDIGSQVSAETTTEGMSGQALIRKFLCEEPQFRALCEKALTRLSRERFVENMRRLLKSFHKSLLREGQTEAEKATAGLLRSRRGRSRISNQLASYMRLEDEDANQTELDIDLGSKQRVEMWARSVAVDPKQELDNHDMGEESSTTSSENDFPFISEVEVFLRESMSFRRLQKEFMLIFMPRTLRHVLLSIPRKYIWVSQEQDLSLSNRAKAWIEDVTLLKWNWWPFCPRKRLLRHSEARVFWRCTCGSVQWEEVSMEQYEFVKKILDYSNEQPGLQHWCRGKGKPVLTTTWPGRMFRQIRSASAAPGSSAAQKYTPPKPILATSSSMHSSSYQGGVATAAVSPGSSRPCYHQRSSSSQQTQTTAPNTATHTNSWILFGVRGGSRILVPSQIPVKGQSTDYSIFQELRKCYQSRRGRLRLWFSIWRLEYCESVKFYRLSLSSMVRDKRELPTHQDYQYQPRPPDAENPPITPHIFQSLFYTCPSPCTRRVPHECIPSRAGNTHLERIPKRKQSFEKDLASYAWGLEAVFEPCFARVVVYHFSILCGPFAFWMCWLWWHPGDWQNASVPMAAVLGGLSLFWSCAGILTSKEHDRK